MTVIGRSRLEKRQVFEVGTLDGKVPPHDLDAEAAVLSACMLAERSALRDVADILAPDHFYSEAHRQTFDAIVRLDSEGKPIDVVTVASRLKDDGRLSQVGGLPYLSGILDSAPVIANARAYAQKVADLWRLRRALLACSQFTVRTYQDRSQSADAIRELEAELLKLADAKAEDRSIHVKPLLLECYQRIATAYENKHPPGIATGFGELDDMIVGLHRKDLTIIAARPGAGKTALMLSILLNVSGASPMLLGDDGKPWKPYGSLFLSLEMPREQIGNRLIAIDSLVSAQSIRTGRIDDADWGPMTWSCERMSKMPIKVDDDSGLTISMLRTKVRRAKAEFAAAGAQLAAVFCDYLQLMKGEHADRREQEIGEISRGLKAVAKDEDVAVLAGCQLNRALESRSNAEKRPRLADLRESGNIEQDADNVIGIHRPAMYGEKDPEGEEGRSELVILKQRNGPTGTAIVRYVSRCTRFEPMPMH